MNLRFATMMTCLRSLYAMLEARSGITRVRSPMVLLSSSANTAITTWPANMVTLASWRVIITWTRATLQLDTDTCHVILTSDSDFEGVQWKEPVLSYFIWRTGDIRTGISTSSI